MSKPRVLLFDIETSPIISYTWGLWDQNVGLNQIVQDWHLLSWSAKWLDDPPPKVMYQDQRNQANVEDDYDLVKALWYLLDQADVVITQNGKSFDHKKINARFIAHQMQPPSSYQHIDTLRIAKKHFGFTSNKLEYMTDKLCTKYKKSGHKKYPGFSLWKGCLDGKLDAWKEMERYNKLDVLALEELYKKLSAWGNDGVNFNVFTDTNKNACQCGNNTFKRQGFYYTEKGKYQRYKCKKCGHESRSKTNLMSKVKRASLHGKTKR